MAAKYTCIDGDMVDAVCFAFYGEESGFTEAVLDANPGLAAKGPALPAGTTIILPDLGPAKKTPAVVKLWD